MENPIRLFGRAVSGKRYKAVEQRLKYAGLKINPFEFIGTHVIVGTIIGVLCGYAVAVWQSNIFWGALGAGMAAFIYYVFLSTLVSMFSDQRARYVETALPDALQLMSANLRSGVSTDEAFIRSARPEFGFLAERIKLAGDKIATGLPFIQAFKEIPKDIDSDILRQTVDLIIEGEYSGGELSSILEGTAVDIRDTATIQREVRSVITVYAAFIFLAVAVIAPVLYAVSTQLASILSSLSKSIAIQFLTEKSPTIQLATSMVSQDFLLMFAYVNLIVTGVFGSLMIALINDGNEKLGLRYIPVVLGISLGLFYVGRLVMHAFFGGIKVL